MFNIGVQGQMALGCVGATAIALYFPAPPWLRIAAGLGFGAVAGGLWALGPALARVRARVNEVISAFMLNYVAWYFVLWLLNGVWQEHTYQRWAQSDQLHIREHIYLLPGIPIHSLALLGILAPLLGWAATKGRAIAVHERLIRDYPKTARYAGVPVDSFRVLTMVLGGSCAGLAGAIEVFAMHDRLRDGVWGSYAFVGILLACICESSYRAIVPLALATGIVLGAFDAEVVRGLPFSGVNLFIGTGLLAFTVFRATGREA